MTISAKIISFMLVLVSILLNPISAIAESAPAELEVLKGSVGVWDTEIEVWPQGPDAESITFEGVETITAYGDHWIAADFVSEFAGETTRVHSIVGYDLDQKKLVGMVIDHGPYSASMTGEYDPESKTVHWTTLAKNFDGTPMRQKASVTQVSETERVLKMLVPSETGGEVLFMEIKYKKRQEAE